MKRSLISVICALWCPIPLASASSPPASAHAPPSLVAPAADAEATLDQALGAWANGEWTKVRNLLEPLLRDGGQLDDPQATESGLRHLADATLFDESLEMAVRNSLATEYIERLLDRDLEWKPPPDTHGRAFEDLLEQVRAERKAKQAASCSYDKAVCEADLHNLQVEQKKTTEDLDELQTKFDAQLVEVQQLATRNRAVALVPFGVGHFYNGRKGFGAGFLATEAAFGITGLSLLLVRTLRYNCTRESGFARGSVVCVPPEDLVEELGTNDINERIANVRNAEQTFGLLFIGAMVVDVIVAQATFKPYVVLKTETIPRSELERRKQEQSQPGRGKRRDGDKPSANIRPIIGPGGAGVKIRF